MRLLSRLALLSAVLATTLFLSGRALAQTTVVLQPDPAAGEDTFVASASQVQNYGALAQISSNSQSNGGEHPLIRFNLSSIPAGATVLSATFDMYYISTKTSSTETLRVHRALRNWTETGATWRTYDGVNSWTTPGGDYDPTVASSAILTGAVNVWISWNMTALVQGWVSGTYPNQGMILESPPAPGNNERQFASSDAASPALRPRLTIVYAASDLGASTESVSAAAPVLGQILTYSIVVRNAGSLAAADVLVTDTVDTSRLTSIVPGQGGILSGGTLTWNRTTTPALASVGPAPGGDVTLTFTARVVSSLADGTAISNQAFLSSSTQSGIPSDDPSTPALDDPTVATVREPVATLVKRIVERNGAPLPDDPSNPPGISGALACTAVPGDVLTYALYFSNGGSRDASSFVARDGVPPWTDFLPDGFSSGRGIRLVLGAATDLTSAADGDAGTFDATATANPDDPSTPVNGLVLVTLQNLPSGTSGSILFRVRVK